MNKSCEICSKSYDVQDSTSFFRFQYCSEGCELVAEERAKEIHVYMCHLPLDIQIIENSKPKTETVQDGSKWRRDDKKSRGLCPVHLENLSGKIDEKIAWVEIAEEVLIKHFQKI